MSGKNTEKFTAVVLGVRGMAGHVMAEYLDGTGECEVLGVAREDGKFVDRVADVLDFSGLESYLEHVSPDIVINCVGVLVSSANRDLANAILANSYLPNFLSTLGRNLGFRLVHISTDCVFSGRAGGYREDSFRDGDDNYARTKALGEINNDRDLTIRTSIVGPELKTSGTGLLGWFLKQEGEIRGYTKAIWSGVTTLELARAAHEMINQDIRGLYQLSPRSGISKYELLQLFREIWPRPVNIVPYPDYIVDKSLTCTRTDFKYHELIYRTMLEEMKLWMDQRPGYYKHYKI